jgi:hypothetical protein
MKAIPMNNPPENEDNTGEFAVFLDSGLDAMAAYIHHKYGEEMLREVFAAVELRESLEDAAAELEHRGLDKPAAVLYELAESAVSGIDMVPDYMVNAGPGFVAQWRRSWRQRRLIHLGVWDQELRRTIARNTRQSEINRRKAP